MEIHLVFSKQSGRSTLGTVAFKTSIAYKFHRNTIPSNPEHLIWTSRLDKCHSKFINRLMLRGGAYTILIEVKYLK